MSCDYVPHNRTTQRHPPLLTLRRPYRALPHALPSAAQVGCAVSAVEEEKVGVSEGRARERWPGCLYVFPSLRVCEAFAPL
eukprot:scaffold95304_cov42-Phaeocystis_antarctica.AAC.1